MVIDDRTAFLRQVRLQPCEHGAMRRLRAAFAAHLGGLPTTFWWLWTGAAVSALATFVFPFLALYLTTRGLDAQRTGLVVALYGVGAMGGGPLAGTLADRLGRRPIVLAALGGCAVSAAYLGLVRSPPLLALGVLAFGLSNGMAHPTFSATIADVVPPAGRAHAFGLLYWANNLGVGFSALVGGALASKSWLGLFFADAATTAIFAMLVWHRVPETRPTPDPSAGEGRGFATVLRDGPLLAFFVVHLGFLLVFWQWQMALPVAMARQGISPAQYGRVIAVNGALIILIQPWAGRLLQRVDPARVLAVAALLVGIGYGAYSVCSTATQFALATGVWSLGEIAALPTAVAVVANLAPPDLRGRYQGAYGLTFAIAMMAAPVLGGTFLERFGWHALWLACLTVGVVVAAAHLAIGPSRRRRLADRPPVAPVATA